MMFWIKTYFGKCLLLLGWHQQKEHQWKWRTSQGRQKSSQSAPPCGRKVLTAEQQTSLRSKKSEELFQDCFQMTVTAFTFALVYFKVVKAVHREPVFSVIYPRHYRRNWLQIMWSIQNIHTGLSSKTHIIRFKANSSVRETLFICS